MLKVDSNSNSFFAELEKQFNTASLKQGMEKAVALVEREARIKAPKGDTGYLKNSIQSSVKVSGTKVIGSVYTNLFYAPYVEFGTGIFAEKGNGRTDVPWKYQDAAGIWWSTVGQAPQPFLRPALTENKMEVKAILKASVTNKK